MRLIDHYLIDRIDRLESEVTVLIRRYSLDEKFTMIRFISERDTENVEAGHHGDSFQSTASGPFDYRYDAEPGSTTNDPSDWLKSGVRSNSNNRFNYGSSPNDEPRPPSKSSTSKNFFDDL